MGTGDSHPFLIDRVPPLKERVPSLSNGNEMSPSLQEKRPFMHRGDSYPFLIDRVLIDRRI